MSRYQRIRAQKFAELAKQRPADEVVGYRLRLVTGGNMRELVLTVPAGTVGKRDRQRILPPAPPYVSSRQRRREVELDAKRLKNRRRRALAAK